MTAIDDLKIALNALAYLPNAVSAWDSAHGGDKVLAKANAEKVYQAEKLLSEVLASLPTGKTYVVHGIGRSTARFTSSEELIEALGELGVKVTGVETDR